MRINIVNQRKHVYVRVKLLFAWYLATYFDASPTSSPTLGLWLSAFSRVNDTVVWNVYIGWESRPFGYITECCADWSTSMTFGTYVGQKILNSVFERPIFIVAAKVTKSKIADV